MIDLEISQLSWKKGGWLKKYLSYNLKKSLASISFKVIWRIQTFFLAWTLIITLKIIIHRIKGSTISYFLLHILLAIFCNTIIRALIFNINEWIGMFFYEKSIKTLDWINYIIYIIIIENWICKKKLYFFIKKICKLWRLSVLIHRFIVNKIV